MTSRQFISNRTWIYLAGIFGMHALAWFIGDNWIALLVLIFIGIATFILTIKNLEDGLLIGVLEIFVGGHGHLFDAEIFGFSLSIRMVIFGAVMLGWLYHFIEGNVYFRFSALRDVPWILLVSAVILGSIIGFATNGFVFAFDDMNGYLAIGYILPFITINWTQKSKRELIIALFAGCLWLIIFTLALSYLFTHLDGKSLHELYVFVRDSRLAEITLQTASDASGNVQNGLYQRFLG
ncbi:hypothetical protein KJ766_01830, partial [Patescibacteria group bacterium]|nr:hypothetical protein [Patescibacteria group bacterium]